MSESKLFTRHIFGDDVAPKMQRDDRRDLGVIVILLGVQIVMLFWLFCFAASHIPAPDITPASYEPAVWALSVWILLTVFCIVNLILAVRRIFKRRIGHQEAL